MRRRSFLGRATAVAVTATAGCAALGLGEQEPILLRATPARGDETDVRCHLAESFVAGNPELESVLERARGNELLEWAEVGISEATARELVDALQHHCEDRGGAYRGLYRYRGDWFFISVSPRGNSTVGLEHTDDGHEH